MKYISLLLLFVVLTPPGFDMLMMPTEEPTTTAKAKGGNQRKPTTTIKTTTTRKPTTTTTTQRPTTTTTTTQQPTSTTTTTQQPTTTTTTTQQPTTTTTTTTTTQQPTTTSTTTTTQRRTTTTTTTRQPTTTTTMTTTTALPEITTSTTLVTGSTAMTTIDTFTPLSTTTSPALTTTTTAKELLTSASSSTNYPTPTTTDVNFPTPTTTGGNSQTPTTTDVNSPTPTTTSGNSQTPTTTSGNSQTPTTTSVYSPTPTTTSSIPPTPTTTSVNSPTPTSTSVNPPTTSTSVNSPATPTSTSVNPPTTTSTSVNSPTPTSTSVNPPTPTSTSVNPPTTTSTSVNPPTTTSTSVNSPTPTSTSVNSLTPTSTVGDSLTSTTTSGNSPTPTATINNSATPTSLTTTSTAQATTTEKPDSTSLLHKKELYELMLNNYDPRIRPIQNQSQPIYINTKFVPLGLIDFDTTLQQFSMMAYIRIGWIDHNINWTPRFYSATYSLRVPTRQIWTPNLILRKSVDGQGVIGAADTDRIYVSWRGHVQWVPEATYSVVCNVNVRYYPFDEQTCTLTFYVPGESVDTLELDHYKNVDMSECMENAAWIIVGVSRTRHIRDNNYNIDIEYKMQRRADFTTFTLVAPLLMLAFLNICVFLVPSNSGEKGSFSITIFLAYSVYMSMMSEALPHNSVEISFFIVFIIVLLCLSVVSVFYTIIQAKLASAFGNKECPLNCFRRTVDRNKVVPVGPAGNLENTCVYTWGNFFDQLDTFLFGSFLVTITLVTGIFFSVLLRNVTFDDPDLNLELEATTRSMPFRTTVAA